MSDLLSMLAFLLLSLNQTGRTRLCFLFDVGFMYLHNVIHNHQAKGMCPHHIIILQLRNFCLPQSYKAQQCFKLSPQHSVLNSSRAQSCCSAADKDTL